MIGGIGIVLLTLFGLFATWASVAQLRASWWLFCGDVDAKTEIGPYSLDVRNTADYFAKTQRLTSGDGRDWWWDASGEPVRGAMLRRVRQRFEHYRRTQGWKELEASYKYLEGGKRNG
jgi:hypothetical protein